MGWFGKKAAVVAEAPGSVAIGGNFSGTITTGQLPVSLEKKRDAARISLCKETPFSLQMDVMAFIDASGSMSPFYSKGVVQEITERALGFSLAMDEDGEIPVYGFGYNHKHYGDVNVSNYLGFVQRSGLGPFGSTNLSASLEFLEKAVKKAQRPVYALIVTDGAPDSPSDVTKRLERLSALPVFVKFLVVGNDRYAWDYVHGTLDDNNFAIDNVDGQKMADPSKLSDQKFADAMVEELPGWYRAATAAGVVK